MMKRSVLLTVVSFLLAWLLPSSAAWAFDRQLTVASGQTLYFDFVEGGVQVVYPDNDATPTTGWGSYTKPTGALTVPSTVSFDGVDYAVVAIGNYAFYNCGGLTSVTLSEGIATVGNGAFSKCSAVTALHLPSTLVSVGSQGFAYLDALAEVWSDAPVPPTGQYMFHNTVVANSTLHLPCGLAEAYGADAVWGQFGTVMEESCEATVVAVPNYAGRGTVTGGGTYMSGTTVTLEAIPDSSFFFACWNDGDTLNPRQLTLTADTNFTALFFAFPAYIPDTIRLIYVIHDTVPDTIYTTIYDTIPDTVHDTIYTTIYDTVHDTVPFLPTIFRVNIQSLDPALGVGVGSGDIPGGIEVEVCALPLEGARFVSWDDGSSENPRRLSVTSVVTLKAHFEPIPSTAIGALEGETFTTAVQGRTLTVGTAAGRRLTIYDSTGRRLFVTTLSADRVTLQLPSSGIYLVQLDDGAARRIVVQ